MLLKSMLPLLNELKVSSCETHHLLNDKPFYPARFHRVLKYHAPGLAPVLDSTGAFHISLEGAPAYTERFKQTFGFYCSYAAVETEIGWFHINKDGKPLYEERYAWCGNFQEDLCSVRSHEGNYFHINTTGQRLYPQNYTYVGDFKDGIAAVCREDGKSSHINTQGELVHSQWYEQLDIFHKRYSRARDEKGWFHITKEGFPAYNQRYANIEPFYNGQAHAQTHERALVIVSETGEVIKEIAPSQKNLTGELSNDLVGFWKSETIKLAVELGLLDILPAKDIEIADRCDLPLSNLQRIMRALHEIGLVNPVKDEWVLTSKGLLLTPKNQSFLAAASQMWAQVQQEWTHLKDKLKGDNISHHRTFKENSTNESQLEIYRRALEGYAQLDFNEVARWERWNKHSSLVAFGQTGITLLKDILRVHPKVKGVLAHEDLQLFYFTIEPELQERLKKIIVDYYKEWPLKAEAVLMPRFLHYFPDDEALSLLQKAYKILPSSGTLYLFEMILERDNPAGGLLDLNMLAESGGRLRTLQEWKGLLSKAGFSVNNCQAIKPYLHLIQGNKG